MSCLRWPAMAAAGIVLAGWVKADQRMSQVQLEVRFVEATSESLRDLGVDIGWGGGASLHFASSEKASVIPFLGFSWDRMTGDHDFRSDMSGFQLGFRFRLTPNAPIEKSQTSLVLAEGYYQNKHRDEVESRTSKGVGFDLGIEVGPAMRDRGPLWRFLFARRPKSFGETTQLMILTASFPVLIKG